MQASWTIRGLVADKAPGDDGGGHTQNGVVKARHPVFIDFRETRQIQPNLRIARSMTPNRLAHVLSLRKSSIFPESTEARTA